MSANENTPPLKRQRHDQPDSERPRGRSSPLSCLELIPLEILAEVLSYVNSPKDVLSVARCSKHLCATLLNPSNVTIWRRARRHCIVPDLPPPPPGWSEPAYAAFIFDEGPCYVCHAVTKRMFWSFVARIRICGQHECRKELFSVHVTVHPPLDPDPNHSDIELSFLKEILNYLEVPVPADGLFGPTRRYCLLTDLDKTTSEFWERIRRNEPPDEYLNGRETELLRQKRILEHAKPLHQWSQRWYHRYRTTKALNVDFARKLATNAGWKLEDLLNTSTYSSLNRSYNARLETITEDDVRLLLTKIDAEILSQAENGERRQKARAQQMRRADVTRHYNRLVEEKVYPVIPILAEFRELPIIKTLQDRDDAMPVLSDTSRSSSAKRAKPPRVLESELKRSGLIGDMIDSDLKKWVHAALVAFDSMLGQPNWKSASTKVLHPAERVTARFICTLCRSLPKTRATLESLNFREACAHECPGSVAPKRKWRADQFAPDKMAIAVLSMALSTLGLSAEDRETEAKIELIDARFVCEACDIVMNFQRLGGHWRRHKEMTIRLVSKANEAVALGSKHPYEAGSLAKYTARTKEAKEMRKMKVFGCRHCRLWRKRFTFDGLISHAKEKHKIFPLADEDFFRDATIDAKGEHTQLEIITSVIGEIEV